MRNVFRREKNSRRQEAVFILFSVLVAVMYPLLFFYLVKGNHSTTFSGYDNNGHKIGGPIINQKQILKNIKNKINPMNSKNGPRLLIAALVLALAIYACSKSSTTTQPPGGNTKTINISGMTFPASTTVTKGTTVIWHNADAFAHTVTSDDGTTFNSGNVAANASFTYLANTAGTFGYHCNIHPGMTGSLVVTP